MSNERDIKRRLSAGTDAEPPAGLLEAIQQEIPEETFGPRTTVVPGPTSSPWRLRAAAAAAVVLAAGLLAVGVARNGALPESIQEVSEVVVADAVPASAEPEQLKALGYVDAEERAVAERIPQLDARPEELQRALPRRDPATANEAAAAPGDVASDRQRLRLAQSSALRELPAAASPSAPAPTTLRDAELKEEESKVARSEAAPPASANLFRVEADEASDAEAEETITVVSEAPVVARAQAPAPRAQQVSLQEVAAERTPEGARARAKRAPAAPSTQARAARVDAFADSDRAPGLQSFEIVRDEQSLVLRAKLEPRFLLELELGDQEWLELPRGEDGHVRYELDEKVLGELRPGRLLRLRTVPGDAGVAVPFAAAIPD